jgi:hypothetical protein
MSGTQARLDAIRAHVCEARRMRTQWTDRELILTENAELLLAELERVMAAHQRCCDDTDYCYVCDNHPSHGHAKDCPLLGGARVAQEDK